MVIKRHSKHLFFPPPSLAATVVFAVYNFALALVMLVKYSNSDYSAYVEQHPQYLAACWPPTTGPSAPPASLSANRTTRSQVYMLTKIEARLPYLPC